MLGETFIRNFPTLNNEPNYDQLERTIGSSPVMVIRCGNSLPKNLIEKLYH
jgi:hypothetical protein